MLNVNDFSDYKLSLDYNFQNTYVTFQTSDLIRSFKSRRFKNLPTIIDLESFDKQMSQEGKEFRESKDWKVLSFLRHHKIIDSEFELKESNFKLFLEHLATSFLKLLTKDPIEKERFEKIEVDINKIIFKRQLLGIKINSQFAEEKCFEIEKEIYRIKNTLQLDYNIFSPENEKQQLSYLNDKGYTLIRSVLYTFKIYSNEDVICNLFYQLIRNERDLDSLIYILSHWGGRQRTYPSYYGFGTITSRITMRQPSLQNLKRVNRTVIVPEIGTKFLYIDYSQFEAGILASLSNDENLIQLYNTDIYADLAKEVFGDSGRRDDAKIIFYRYMYGDKNLYNKAKSYFSKFKKLAEFKQKINSEIDKNMKISSVFGNSRHCFFGEEPVWPLSHIIQSTASLIYKKAVLRVNKEINRVEFLIPMHDATLYQINELEYENIKMQIEDIYREEFKKICPQINPRVRSSDSYS